MMRLEYVTQGRGVMLFASSRAALIEAAPEHRARIVSYVSDEQLPAWLAVIEMVDRENVTFASSAIGADVPAWWRALAEQFQRSLS